MELNKGFRFAVILAWEDLVKVSRPCSARVEYLCEPGAALDYVSVWSVRAGGQQDLVCDYWTWTSAAHPRGLRFRNGPNCFLSALSARLSFRLLAGTLALPFLAAGFGACLDLVLLGFLDSFANTHSP